MKWYHYLSCFLAGVFLIHILPHALNGPSLTNLLGILVSLVGGGLLLWAGRFSLRNPLRDPWKIALVVLGMASVLIFAALHPHQPHSPPSRKSIDSPMQ
jgi:hypothetical protein